MAAPSPATVRRHNQVIAAGLRRADELEPQLVAILEPILARAGEDAARQFERKATDHLVAALTASLVGAPALTASGPANWTPPAGDEIVDVDAIVRQIRERTEPVRRALVETVMTPALEAQGLSWDATNPLTAKALAESGSQVRHIGETTRLNVMRTVRASYDQGLTIPETARAIRAGMSAASNARATMIARTELVRAVNAGSLAATQIVSDATGASYNKVWMTAPGAAHPRHELEEGLDGQTVQLDEPFSVGGADLMYPGDPSGPPEETINCFPGSALVVAPGLEMAFRRRYEGDLVRLETDSGRSLAGTPNHPVLTDAGWKPLGLVCEGDHLVCATPVEGEGVADPDVDSTPSAIHQVFSALTRPQVPRRVSGIAVQFHGDVSADSEVEVVRADRDLWVRLDAALREHRLERQFVRAGEGSGSFASERLRGGFGGPDTALAAGGMGGGRQSASLVDVGSRHTHDHRLGAGPRSDAQLAESAVDDRTTDGVSLGQRLYGDAFVVSAEQVVVVERESFHGDVYNLQTRTGAYIVAGIIVHNCRCSMSYDDGSGGTEDITADEDFDPEAIGADAESPDAYAIPSGEETADISIGDSEPVARDIQAFIVQRGLNKPLRDLTPESDVGRRVYAKAGGKGTEGLYMHGGEWMAGRRQLHAEIIARFFLDHMPPPPGTELHEWFTAGGGASGKSFMHFVDENGSEVTLDDLRARGDVIVVDPDEIKKMLPEFDLLANADDIYAASGVHEESSYLAKRIVEEARKEGYHVVLDSTASTSKFAGKIDEAIAKGRKVHVSMVSVPTNRAIERMVDRGLRKRRFVLVPPLKEAHVGASKNMMEWTRDPRISSWRVYESSAGDARLVAHGGNGQIDVLDRNAFESIARKGYEDVMGPPPDTAPPTPRAPSAVVDNRVSSLDPSKKDVEDALAMLDKHLLVPSGSSTFPVNVVGTIQEMEGADGVYQGETRQIFVKRLSPDRYSTFVHEFGHALDNMHGQLESFASWDADRLGVREWQDAVVASPTVQRLGRALLKAERQGPDAKVEIAQDIGQGPKVYQWPQDVVRYILNPAELWTRSFVQWLASRDPRLADGVKRMMQDEGPRAIGWYWPLSEFAPIAKTLDEFYEKRGLLKS